MNDTVFDDIVCSTEESFYISILTEKGNTDEISKIFGRKEKAIGNKGKAMCYFKVS